MEGNPQCVPDSIQICSLNDKILFACQGHHHRYRCHQWVLECQEKHRFSVFRELHVMGRDRGRQTYRQSLHSVISEGGNRFKVQWGAERKRCLSLPAGVMKRNSLNINPQTPHEIETTCVCACVGGHSEECSFYVHKSYLIFQNYAWGYRVTYSSTARIDRRIK